MAKSYNHREIEAKWNQYWTDQKLYEVDPATLRPFNKFRVVPSRVEGRQAQGDPELSRGTKADQHYYCLDMFPYPSGDGLHVGHWRGYVMSDFYARYMRLQGKTVLHPMGFDAFGLPAENAAIKSKSHPKKFTNEAIVTFSKQLKQIGAAYDWTKTLNTSSPEYYRWTQWLFLQLFKHGFAEKRQSLVNWCPKDQTVLANEQVVNGCCERCGSKVTKKELEQWYFLTTKLADELLEGLEEVEWPEHVKTLQRNWIGRSNGANVEFKIQNSNLKVNVFTTRPDTLFGVTAIVLAPEHSLVKELCAKNGQEAEFAAYYEAVAAKTNVDRAQGKETAKTAMFTGVYAVHPITREKLPVWIADYVLMEYGTGAVMSVPAHDERDFLFASAHDLPIMQVIETDQELPYSGLGILTNSGEYSKQSSEEASDRMVADLETAGIGKFTTTYRLRDWLVSRQRYWGAPIPIVYDPAGIAHPVKDEHLPLQLPEDVDFLPGGISPLARSSEYKKLAEKLYGKGWHFDTDTLDTFVDSSWYFLRYLSPTNDKAAFDKVKVRQWLPVDLYIGGIEHATLHLLYARFMYRFLVNHKYINPKRAEPFDSPRPGSGQAAQGEPFKKLFNIGMINMHGAKMSKSKGNVVSPDPLIQHYGTDALRGYELFIGPLDVEAEWSPNGINGVHRFLIKTSQLFEKVTSETTSEMTAAFEQYLSQINDMIANFRLNTVISEYMKLANTFEKAGVSKELFEKFVITLSPIFPYLAEELFHNLGHKQSVFSASWPTSSGQTVKKQIPVLVNQRFVTNIDDPGSQIDTERVVNDNPTIKAKITGKAAKVIYKAGSVVNIVVS